MNNPKKSESGLTLVEIIVGLALLGIIVVVIGTVYTSSVLLAVRSGGRTKNVSDAATIAESAISGYNQAEIDELIANDFPHSITDYNRVDDKLTVKFGTSIHETEVDVDKIVIKKEETVNDEVVETEIYVYRAYNRTAD
ncbi:type II secretion system protein [Natronincola ferrireducens]|uniref:Prepilin-type N-terminal cleavage/methylation domain-containing protein n=1 Tax=Natronincola ferrireducens TaxID=393762 RepID=A0A1G9CL42_9FIRM|nr:type II secretion system protein [Natronincola ferrireducens]SDK52410.1 hypothetical protein SAMN05660472_01495 [Natronincola ferrireducens]